MEDFITISKKRATNALDYFLLDLSFVPADKLTWKPTPTAKSAVEIAAHCAGYSPSFASVIRTGKFPRYEEFRATVQSAIDSITTLEEAETMLRKSIEDSIAALETVKPEQIDSSIETPQGQTPFKFFLTLPAMHLENHAAQINYLQTCWGDLEVHLLQS